VARNWYESAVPEDGTKPDIDVTIAHPDPWGLVAGYLSALPAGSYLVISHPASDVDSGSSERAAQRYNERVASRMRRRSRDEVTRFFDGLDLVQPGIVQLHRWRATADSRTAPSSGYAGVGRKP
jgi:S-adenosyl methyltransferase